MSVKVSLDRLCRAGLVGHHETVRKRMGEMLLAVKQAEAEGRSIDLLGICEALETVIASYERGKANSWKADGPTPETARKLRQDPILVLLQRGVIDKDDENIITELRELRYKLTMGLVPGGHDINGERVDTSRKGYTHPAEKLTDRQALLLKHVYRPWSEQASRSGIAVGKRGRIIQLTSFRLVTSIIEGVSTFRALETEYRVTTGALAQPFKRALNNFSQRLEKAESEGKVPRRKK